MLQNQHFKNCVGYKVNLCIEQTLYSECNRSAEEKKKHVFI